MLHGMERLEAHDLDAGSIRVEERPVRPGEAAAFRVELQLRHGRRVAFQLLLDDRYREPAMRETLLTLLRVAGAPVRIPSLSRFGSFMPEAGAISLGEPPGRVLSALMDGRDDHVDAVELRRWWVSAIEAWIRGWRDSGGRLMPGAIEAGNIVIPLLRYREGAVIASVAGWRRCEGSHCLVTSLFGVLHRAREQWDEPRLQSSWVVDAFFDVLGSDEAHAMLTTLTERAGDTTEGIPQHIVETIGQALDERSKQYCPPLAVRNAVACWKEWAGVYPLLVEERGEEYLRHVIGLYGVSRFGDAARWYVTLHTTLGDLPEECRRRLEAVLLRMQAEPGWTATRSTELAELQELLPPGQLRARFLHMVFPSREGAHVQMVRRRVAGRDAVVVEHAVGGDTHGELVIRDGLTAADIGAVLSLLMRERFPVPTGENLRYLGLVDEKRGVVGGLVYAAPEHGEVELKAIVVEESLRGRGLGKALIDDLALRVRGSGASSLRAPHYLLPFCVRAGFSSDPNDGELRRPLEDEVTGS